MSKIEWSIVIGAGLFMILLVASLSIEATDEMAIKANCRETCLPYAQKIINNKCHCANKHGWVLAQ